MMFIYLLRRKHLTRILRLDSLFRKTHLIYKKWEILKSKEAETDTGKVSLEALWLSARFWPFWVSSRHTLTHTHMHPSPKATQISIRKCLGRRAWIQNFKLNRKGLEKQIDQKGRRKECSLQTTGNRKQVALVFTTGTLGPGTSYQKERGIVFCSHGSYTVRLFTHV